MVVINNRSSAVDVTSYTPLDESTRNNILDAILAADAKLPENYTTADVSRDTKRIALKFGVRPMQVAGVRAALSKGQYDEMVSYS